MPYDPAASQSRWQPTKRRTQPLDNRISPQGLTVGLARSYVDGGVGSYYRYAGPKQHILTKWTGSQREWLLQIERGDTLAFYARDESASVNVSRISDSAVPQGGGCSLCSPMTRLAVRRR